MAEGQDNRHNSKKMPPRKRARLDGISRRTYQPGESEAAQCFVRVFTSANFVSGSTMSQESVAPHDTKLLRWVGGECDNVYFERGTTAVAHLLWTEPGNLITKYICRFPAQIVLEYCEPRSRVDNSGLFRPSLLLNFRYLHEKLYEHHLHPEEVPRKTQKYPNCINSKDMQLIMKAFDFTPGQHFFPSDGWEVEDETMSGIDLASCSRDYDPETDLPFSPYNSTKGFTWPDSPEVAFHCEPATRPGLHKLVRWMVFISRQGSRLMSIKAAYCRLQHQSRSPMNLTEATAWPGCDSVIDGTQLVFDSLAGEAYLTQLFPKRMSFVTLVWIKLRLMRLVSKLQRRRQRVLKFAGAALWNWDRGLTERACIGFIQATAQKSPFLSPNARPPEPEPEPGPNFEFRSNAVIIVTLPHLVMQWSDAIEKQTDLVVRVIPSPLPRRHSASLLEFMRCDVLVTSPSVLCRDELDSRVRKRVFSEYQSIIMRQKKALLTPTQAAQAMEKVPERSTSMDLSLIRFRIMIVDHCIKSMFSDRVTEKCLHVPADFRFYVHNGKASFPYRPVITKLLGITVDGKKAKDVEDVRRVLNDGLIYRTTSEMAGLQPSCAHVSPSFPHSLAHSNTSITCRIM